jgi:hypothetical protein
MSFIREGARVQFLADPTRSSVFSRPNDKFDILLFLQKEMLYKKVFILYFVTDK